MSKKQSMYEQELARPKFLPKGETVSLSRTEIDNAIQVQVDGKFGKQLMYLVNSDLGKIYLKPIDYVKVYRRFVASSDMQALTFP
jgi:hypothetical protein